MDQTQPLALAQLHAALHSSAVGHTIDYHVQIDSTMPRTHALAADPQMTSGTIVVAEEQTAGRGRHTRRWETPPGRALLVSLLLKAPLPIAPTAVPMAAGLALLHACCQWQPALVGQIGLKWPNDLLVGTAPPQGAKVAGILVESSYRGNAVGHVVIGMGINVLQTPTELPPAQLGAPPPTSLRHFLQTVSSAPPTQPVDRTALLIHLCHAWAALLADESTQPALIERWRAALWTLGQRVTVHDLAAPGVVNGVAVDVTTAGHLVVETANGERHTFAAGDVSLRSGA